ncbi:Protein CKI-1 [Aphelenchoides avenae]|nr:Protein CKI-1 [Aphelenchus avenae]
MAAPPSSPRKRVASKEGEGAAQKVPGARRCLFGPSDSAETTKWLKDGASAILEEKTKKWNFDFRNDKPLDGAAGSSGYVYETVAKEDTPSVYHPAVKPRGPPRTPIKRYRLRTTTATAAVAPVDASAAPSVDNELLQGLQAARQSSSEMTSPMKLRKRPPPVHETPKQAEGTPAKKKSPTAASKARRSLRQAKLTNYISVFKRKRTRSSCEKSIASRLRSSDGRLNGSPFRFLDEHEEQQLAIMTDEAEESP